MAKRKKRRTHVKEESNAQGQGKKTIPRSMVMRRGKLAAVLKPLEQDMRKVMMPYTAAKLKETKKNSLKDFVEVTGPLGVSHLIIFSATETSHYLKVGKTPRGPTLTLRLHEYSLMADIANTQNNPRCPISIFQTPPLVVLSKFTSEDHLRLATIVFQNMFPTINAGTVKLSSCQRVVLLAYNEDTNHISFRHYSITATPAGVSRSIRKILQRKTGDMSSLQDVADFVTRAGYGSESEGEDEPDRRVTMAQDARSLGRGNKASHQSAVKLHEVGPRMELELIKVEEGLAEGAVLYHKYVEKSEAEATALREGKEQKDAARVERRRQQDANVRKKAEEKARKDKHARAVQEAKELASGRRRSTPFPKAPVVEDDDDEEYYRQEVGENPDEMFLVGSGRGRGGRDGGRGGGRGGGRSRGDGYQGYTPRWKEAKQGDGEDGGGTDEGSGGRGGRRGGGRGFSRDGGGRGGGRGYSRDGGGRGSSREGGGRGGGRGSSRGGGGRGSSRDGGGRGSSRDGGGRGRGGGEDRGGGWEGGRGGFSRDGGGRGRGGGRAGGGRGGGREGGGRGSKRGAPDGGRGRPSKRGRR